MKKSNICKKRNIVFLILISFFLIQSHFLEAQVFKRVKFVFDIVPNTTSVHSIFITEINDKWMATENGIVLKENFMGNESSFIPKISTLLIADAPDNKLWCVTHRNGIIILDRQERKFDRAKGYANLQIKEEYDLNFLGDKTISNLAFPKDSKTVWIASRGSGLWKKTGEEITKIKLQKKDSPEDISDIILFEHKLWVATTTGIYYTKDISANDTNHKFVQISDFTKANKMIVYRNQLWILGFDTALLQRLKRWKRTFKKNSTIL